MAHTFAIARKSHGAPDTDAEQVGDLFTSFRHARDTIRASAKQLRETGRKIERPDKAQPLRYLITEPVAEEGAAPQVWEMFVRDNGDDGTSPTRAAREPKAKKERKTKDATASTEAAPELPHLGPEPKKRSRKVSAETPAAAEGNSATPTSEATATVTEALTAEDEADAIAAAMGDPE